MTADTTITIDTTDIDSIAKAISSGITTVELMAEYLGLDLVEDCLVLDDSPVYADDGNAEIDYDSETSHAEAAQSYVDDGDWGQDSGTCWVSVSTYRKGIATDGTITNVDIESHTITVEATEPDCEDGQAHEWQSPYDLLGGLKENPGVQGHGGGVVITECCMICGCARVTDTWAQNPSTGEQGLTSVKYEEGRFASEVHALHLQRAMDRLGATNEDTEEQDYEWIDDAGDLVGASEDEMREYGIALLSDDAAPKISGDVVRIIHDITCYSEPDDDANAPADAIGYVDVIVSGQHRDDGIHPDTSDIQSAIDAAGIEGVVGDSYLDNEGDSDTEDEHSFARYAIMPVE